jgi:hypothetical protein
MQWAGLFGNIKRIHKKFKKYIELRQAHYGEVLLLVSQIADWTVRKSMS